MLNSSHLTIELSIFTVWTALLGFSLFTKKRNFAFFLLSPIPAAILLEIANEVLFRNEGTYYPETLLTFPGFSFPIAIILFSSLFTFFICLFTTQIEKKLIHKKKPIRFIITFTTTLLLILTFFPIEKTFTQLEYWKYHIQPNTYVYVFMYIYYLIIVAPTFMLHHLLRRKEIA